MKKIFLSFLFGMIATTAIHAQFRTDTPPFGQDKVFIGASMTGLDMGSKMQDFDIDLAAKGGYMFADNFLALGELSYNYREHTEALLSIGAGVRYYIEQNGIFLGAGCRMANITHDVDFQPYVSAGYAFFLSRTVTLEPEVYFNFSTDNFDNSQYGLRIGIGIYLFNDK